MVLTAVSPTVAPEESHQTWPSGQIAKIQTGEISVTSS